MLETPHVVVGAAIALKVGNPALAIPLSLASHFILEQVPHWNPHLNTELKKFGKITKQTTYIILADVAVSIFLGSVIAARALPDYGHVASILVCCLVAILPDLVEGPYFFLKVRGKLIQKWINIQKSIQANANFLPGMATQITTILAALWWVMK